MSEVFRDLLVDQLVASTSFDFDTAELCVAEFFDRFMTLKSACQDVDNKRVCPSKKIDLVWQHAVLNTKLYAEFCDDLAGKFYHYTPQPMVDEFQMRLITTKYYDTLAAYTLRFGKPSEKIWPPLSDEQTTSIINHSAWVRRIAGYNDRDEPVLDDAETDNDDDDDDDNGDLEMNAKQLIKKKRSGMCVFVKFFTNRCLQLVIEADDKLHELAVQLFEQQKIPIDSQYFVHDGKVLDSQRTPFDYNIQMNATLEMRLRLRGC